MTNKDSKSQTERAQEVQANSTPLAQELGLTEDELTTITAFCGIIQNRIDAAPIEPFLAEAELHIRTKFPNNQDAQDLIDQNQIEDRALKFVEDSALGYPSGNLAKPAPVADAKNQVNRANVQCIASPADTDRQCSYAKSIRWLAQVTVQQAFKDALEPVFNGVHQVHRGYKWTAPDQTQKAVTSDQTLNLLMG